tara:strand:- start:2558 stop:3436 length:879 start_codon:yes stop_codon:yes gene_type:complete
MEQQNNTEMNTELNNNVQTHPLFRLMMQSINMIPQQDGIPPQGMMNPQGLMNLQGMPGDILQRTFEEQQPKEKPCCNKFIEELQKMEIIQEDVDNKLSCSICLDEFKLGERVLELPCEPSKHYFHIKNENCEGIIPWLSHNNTCPMCRYEFPTPVEEPEGPEGQEEPEGQEVEMPSMDTAMSEASMPQAEMPQASEEGPQELRPILTPEQIGELLQEEPQSLNDILRAVLLRRNLEQMASANTNINASANEVDSANIPNIINLGSIMPQMDIIRDGFSDRDIDEALRRSLED